MAAKGLNDSGQDMEYQTFTLQDFESEGEPLLTKIDYLTDMFDLEIQNEQGKPIVITLREKGPHLATKGLKK